MAAQVTVTLDRESGKERDRRFTVQGSGLHCGEGLNLLLQGKVLQGRVEYSDWLGWYWVWEDGDTGPIYRMPLVEGMPVVVER